MSRPRRLFTIEPTPISTASLRWSAPLGTWRLGGGIGVPVRMHVSLAAVLVLAVGVCWQSGEPAAWLALAAYLTSLLLHEAAHLAAAVQSVGGRMRLGRSTPVVFGPLGGLTTIGSMSDPRERVFCAMAGPVASLALVVASMGCLAASGVDLAGLMLTDPTLVTNPAVAATPLTLLASLMLVINWPLFLINIAPASPFDGGVALRSWLSVWIGRRRARDATCIVALLIAAGLIGAAGALVVAGAAEPVFTATLAVVATLIAFGARADATAGEMHDIDWLASHGDDPIGISLSDLPRGSRLDASHAGSEDTDDYGLDIDTEHSLAAYEDRWAEDRVDDILAKVHSSGMSELTANERAILQRASRLYQNRRHAAD